eukprot:GHVO01069280.1.p1 GENE.GHVO01069280.1~~GHVO01069280.1.p1  ORF type:complete len:449 (+),score=41.53 GHVO01069280.1:24-1349(+)
MDATATKSFLKFLNSTGSPYHSVAYWKPILLEAGYVELKEGTKWAIKSRSKYFVTRNDSAIMAFTTGIATDAESTSFVISSSHADSPCLKLRPVCNTKSESCIQLGVECYGGGLWHTWFDRGLGIAGKVVCKTEDKTVKEHLVRIADPICMMPNLAIHLQNAEERAAFKVNKEKHLRPILCTDKDADAFVGENREGNPRIPDVLKSRIALEIGADPSSIVDADLCLFDSTESRLCGLYKQWVESPRLDNLATMWASMEALLEFPNETTTIAVSVAFDHEEIGSLAYDGADSSMLESWLQRVVVGLGMDLTDFPAIMSKSMLLAIDMAHAVHPNYAERHQPEAKPVINGGIVIKENTNMRYTTNATTSAITRAIADRVNVPNDSPCGSTIGPSCSAVLGIQSVDIGIPQWAMHSIRETCGILDVMRLRMLISGFFEHFLNVV